MPYVKINTKYVEFATVIYIDANNGNDSTGTGTELNPYKTLSSTTIGKVVSHGTCIVLKAGTYTTAAIALGAYNLTIVGEGKDTVIVSTSTVSKTTNTTLTLYNLVWKHAARFLCAATVALTAYNVVFEATGSDVYLLYSNPTNHYFYNCVIIKTSTSSTTALFIGGFTSVTLVNCYYMDQLLNKSTWYSPNRYIVTKSLIRNTFVNIYDGNGIAQGTVVTPNIDSTTYAITLSNSMWQDIGYGADPDGSVANIGVYGGEYGWGHWAETRYFFYDDNQYKVYRSDVWSTPLGSNVPSESDYLTYGMNYDELCVVTKVILQQLVHPTEVTIKQYVDNLSYSNPFIINNSVIEKTLALNSSDIPISSVASITSMTAVTTETGTSSVKFIVSFDRGTTWYGYDTGNAQFIAVTNLTKESGYTDVTAYGMTKATFNAITSEKWNTLRGDSSLPANGYLRFGLFFTTQSNTSIASVDSITMSCTLKGAWASTIPSTDFTYKYNDHSLIIQLLTAGSYKVNYYFRHPVTSSGVDTWEDILNKPETFTPIDHTHLIEDVSDLQYVLDNKSNLSHTHSSLHTHSNRIILENISIDEHSGDPLWMGEQWPGNLSPEERIETFIRQYDTPNTYSGNENKYVKVKADRSGLEFVELHTSTPSTGTIVGAQISRRYAILYGTDN